MAQEVRINFPRDIIAKRKGHILELPAMDVLIEDVHDKPPASFDKFIENARFYGHWQAEGNLQSIKDGQGDGLGVQLNYDGIHVFWNLWKRFGDPVVKEYAEKILEAVVKYSIPPAGGAPGAFNYNLGPWEVGVEQSNDVYKDVALLFALRSAYSAPWNVTYPDGWNETYWGIVGLSREIANATHSHLVARPYIARAESLPTIGYALPIVACERKQFQDQFITEAVNRFMLRFHIPAWIQCANDGTYWEDKWNWAPFMMGLTARALIRYYDNPAFTEGKELIIPRLADLARVVWQKGFRQNPPYHGLLYRPLQMGGEPPAPDLSLIVFPWYAWLWKQTADEFFKSCAISLMESGAEWAWLYGFKQFNQSYLWSFDGCDYMGWS